jgi:single-strand DNA-binding protein
MAFEGINNVELQGELCWPELKYTGTGKPLFKAKVRIPSLQDRSGDSQDAYLRITAWDEFATYLNSLPARARVRVSGRVQERSFTNREGKKQNITEIVINGAETVETEEGINRFHLRGELVWPDLKQVGERGTNLFRSKVVVPFYREDDPNTLKKAYVRITAWDEIAEGLNVVGQNPGSVVDVTGHIQERSVTMDSGQKRVFTDAVVTNFVLAAGAA